MEETPKAAQDFHSSVDTSRPFRSVKEAVAIFGERILVGEINSAAPTTTTTNISSTPNNSYVNSPVLVFAKQEIHNTTSPSANKLDRTYSSDQIFDALKKVEAELEETKVELKLLKEREQETEVAVASLNAELHKNMSKLAEAEAAKAAKAAKAAAGVESSRGSSSYGDKHEERIRRELVRRMEKNPTLAQILSLGEKDVVYSHARKRERKMVKKKKPIVPLVGDFFFRKK